MQKSNAKFNAMQYMQSFNNMQKSNGKYRLPTLGSFCKDNFQQNKDQTPQKYSEKTLVYFGGFPKHNKKGVRTILFLSISNA